MQLSASYDSIATWGVNSAGNVWTYGIVTPEGPGDTSAGSNWYQVLPSPILVQVSLGSALDVWGINSNCDIYQYAVNSNMWKLQMARDQFVLPSDVQYAPSIQGGSIAVGSDNTVWALLLIEYVPGVGAPPGFTYAAYRRTGKTFKLISDSPDLGPITVGSASNVWILNGSAVSRYSGNDNNPWNPIPGALSAISTAANGDGTLWGCNLDGEVYYYNAKDKKKPWKQVPGTLLQISVGSNSSIWGIDGIPGSVYQFSGTYDPNTGDYTPNGANPWILYPQTKLTSVCAVADGGVWGLNTNEGRDGEIWTYDWESG